MIFIDMAGGIVDVAFYEGTRPNGDHWWILADVELNDVLITHWAIINYPILEDT